MTRRSQGQRRTGGGPTGFIGVARMSEKQAKDAVPAADAGKGGKKKLMIIIAAVVLVLVLGGGGAAFLLMGKKKDAGHEASAGEHAAVVQEEQAQEEAAAEDTAAEGEPAPAKKKKKANRRKPFDPHHAPTFVDLDSFTVNLADAPDMKMMQVKMSLEVLDAESGEALKALMPAVRNEILLLLGSKHATEMASLEGKQALAGDVMDSTNALLKGSKFSRAVQAVQFQQMIVQ
jgi:flagellar FliL protein